MNNTGGYTLPKAERICSKLDQGRLFGGGSHSVSAYPVRAVYRLEEASGDTPKVRIMVSVPKKCFKRAVKRNRVKRQLRESYRLNKHSLIDVVARQNGRSLMVAFIWLDANLWPTEVVMRKMKNILQRIGERIAPVDTAEPTVEPTPHHGDE